MSENEKNVRSTPSWEDAYGIVRKSIQDNVLATETIKSAHALSKAKNIGIVCLTVFSIIVVSWLSIINYRQSQTIERNNQNWIDYLSQYDFVTQDGEGYNYYNSEIGGDVFNGAENTPKEE